jgi:probable lipoprotein NlpC
MKLDRHALLLGAVVIILSACHSKKVVYAGPGEVVQPQAGVADPINMVDVASISGKYAQLMGVKKSDITNERLYSFIEQWAGTPYRFGGLDREGVDCSGLTYLLEEQVYGIKLPRITWQQVAVIKRKYEEELKEGDLVFFDFDGKQFSHVGVYLQNGYIVHASSTKGVIVVPLRGAMYKYFSRAGSIMTDSLSTSVSLQN